MDPPHRWVHAPDAATRERLAAGGAFGPGRVSFDLAVEDGALVYRQSSIQVAGLPIPSSLSPRVGAVVSATAEGWRVAVTVNWLGWIVCRYAGTIRAS